VLALNQWLACKCRRVSNVYVLDYCGLVGKFGAIHWYDRRMSHLVQAPVAMDMLRHLVNEYVKFFRALTGQAKRCLVLDLDNTLWGGTLGESGIDGIQLGPKYPGSAFVEFQQSILQLHKKGLLLAIASKNNAEEVDEVFQRHRHMVLKKEHFVSTEIHWNSKVASIEEISRRTNMGLDQIVFMDDNAVECAAVSQSLPAVHVICLPDQPELFVDFLMRDGLFDTIVHSNEDGRRSELYRQRAEAEMARSGAASLEAFYRCLETKVTFAPLRPATLQRAAQITQKTNQFNATTRRYTEAALQRLMDDPNWITATVMAEDRFGDNGIVGLIIGHVVADILEIDTFLLSCRVIGRTIESAMLAYIWQRANQRGLREIVGYIVDTPKNAPVRDVFERHRFQKALSEKADETVWTLSVNESPIPCPDWIETSCEV
jgi:FkbH-like protein